MRLEALCECAKNEPMRHILDDPVNCVCEFTGIIEGLQMAVISTILTAVQRMLNILANCSIDIAARGFVIAERSVFSIHIGIIEGKFSRTKRTTVANVFVNTVNAWDSISPFVMTLAHGGGDFYDGWMKNPKSAMISCNDGFRPVSFYLEALDEDAE